ncbi:MAG TPA: agmatinase [Gemmatimonadaceae bacterium]|nr:agmatinase [Gemmatimonadaceae bacterium]
MPERLPRIIGLPYDAASSFRRGAADAPDAIRAALHSPAGNLWSEDLLDLGSSGMLTDAGNVEVTPGEHARRNIEAGIASVLRDGAVPIALGGDHAVTYAVLRAIHAEHGPCTIVHVDAHPDLYDEFEGDRYSHACPFARIMEEQLAARLVQVGIRAMNGHQRAQADRFGVEVFDMRAWESGTRPLVRGPVYLSIDLDGIDPAHAPGVSHREPGGLTVRDVVGLIQRVRGTLVGADVVELNPSRDVDDLTARVAAKLVKELAARMISGERP